MGDFVTGGKGFIGAIILGKSPSIPLEGVKMSKQSMYYDSSKAVGFKPMETLLARNAWERKKMLSIVLRCLSS